ncbi:hypothetical protein [Ruegeria arenilitoris]|uniref:Uncharacterized protein n=1 Tax=Ruegeria arenilitoris TaxID=1173585 RepID=A0A238L0G5_9RHOB|nr:hypothetical protein [Ruegeria arenilitoris]SMX48360.1 hypothetical protein RUA8715_03444 [Ruegeria arenilitoris]
MADKSSVRTGIEFSATVIAVIGAVWAGKTYFETWMHDTIDKAVEEKIAVIEKLQLADLLVLYGYPDEAISELRKIADRVARLDAEDKRRIAFYDNYLDAVADSDGTLKFEPEIRMLHSVFSNEMQTDGWHDEKLAYVAMFLPEAQADDGYFDRQVVGRLKLAVSQYEADDDYESLGSAYRNLSLAYLCRGEQDQAVEAMEMAAEMQPFEYYFMVPMWDLEDFLEEPEIKKLDTVCSSNVSRGYARIMQSFGVSENPVREFLREYTR